MHDGSACSLHYSRGNPKATEDEFMLDSSRGRHGDFSAAVGVSAEAKPIMGCDHSLGWRAEPAVHSAATRHKISIAVIAAPSSATPGASSLAHTFSRVDRVGRDFKIGVDIPYILGYKSQNIFYQEQSRLLGENIPAFPSYYEAAPPVRCISLHVSSGVGEGSRSPRRIATRGGPGVGQTLQERVW